MRLRLAVFKEVHRRSADKPKELLHEGIRGDRYRCRISFSTPVGERRMEVWANDPESLHGEVDKMVSRLAGEVVGTSFELPEGVEAREFIRLLEDNRGRARRLKKRRGELQLRDDGRPASRRFDSSGYVMIAEPLALNPGEIEEYNGKRDGN